MKEGCTAAANRSKHSTWGKISFSCFCFLFLVARLEDEHYQSAKKAARSNYYAEI